MIIEKEYVNQLRLTRYNLKLALQKFQGFEPCSYLKKDLERLTMLIYNEYDDGELGTVIDDLLYNARLLSRDIDTVQQQDNFKELYTHINMLDAISERIHELIIDYTCYWSPKSEHTYCQHEHCIFDEEWMKKEAEKNEKKNKSMEMQRKEYVPI